MPLEINRPRTHVRHFDRDPLIARPESLHRLVDRLSSRDVVVGTGRARETPGVFRRLTGSSMTASCLGTFPQPWEISLVETPALAKEAALPSNNRIVCAATIRHGACDRPAYLSLYQISRLDRVIKRHFDLEPNGERAIEIDPRVTSPDQLDLLHRLGFNRLSMGVQDFTPEVQEAINRSQSHALTRNVYAHARAAGFRS